MSEAKDQPQKLMDLVTPQTTFNDLLGLVKQFINPEEEKFLGGGETAAQKVADSIAYLGAFVPAPATLDEEAFFMTATLDLPKEEALKILEIDRRIGVLQDESAKELGRMSVSPEVVKAARDQFLD